MKRKAFDQLARSVRQAGRIRRGEAKASRSFAFAPADVKAIRRKLCKSQQDAARRGHAGCRSQLNAMFGGR